MEPVVSKAEFEHNALSDQTVLPPLTRKQIKRLQQLTAKPETIELAVRARALIEQIEPKALGALSSYQDQQRRVSSRTA